MNECSHGQLARSCRECELEAELTTLRAENERLRDDAERYRWWAAQMELTVEHATWEEPIKETGTRVVYEKCEEFRYNYQMKDDWRLFGAVKKRELIPALDAVVDAARQEEG